MSNSHCSIGIGQVHDGWVLGPLGLLFTRVLKGQGFGLRLWNEGFGAWGLREGKEWAGLAGTCSVWMQGLVGAVLPVLSG